jgi:hypothetical protein
MSNFSAKRLLLLRERDRDAEKRRAALEDDPDCRDVLPNRICYVWCKFVLRLGTDTTYKLRFWDRHKDTNRHVANGGAAAGHHGSQAVGLRVSKPRRLDGTIPNVVWRHGARPYLLVQIRTQQVCESYFFSSFYWRNPSLELRIVLCSSCESSYEASSSPSVIKASYHKGRHFE